jgi:hypothetical protein
VRRDLLSFMRGSRAYGARVPRRFVLGLLVLGLTAGCVEQDPPGVGIQKLSADIVFGVKLPEPAPPANLAPGPVNAEGEAVTYAPTISAPAVVPGLRAPRPRLPITPLTPAKSTCPPAAVNAFPAKEAAQPLEGRPAEGQYRWKRQGTQTLATLPGVVLPVAGFEQRLIRNVKPLPTEGEFSYEMVQPELGTGRTVISTFRVKPAAVSRGVDLVTGLSLRAGDPERGLSLASVTVVDREGNAAVQNFTPAVLYLPLPVEPGESWTSVGIDPRTGAVLQHQAQVVRRLRVDACGDVVDGWLVEATQTFTSTSGSTPAPVTYRYVVATQLGGILISEERHVTSPQGNTDVTFTLAQLRPTPLPGPPAAEAKH